MPINWFELTLSALTNVGFTTAILGALAFLGKAIIERWLSNDLEQHKANLQAANAEELERIRANLQLAGFEYETRFAELHKKQAQVIAEFYELLVIVEEKIRWMGSILVGDDEAGLSSEAIGEKRAEDALKVLNNLIDYYTKRRLYFKESTCEKISTLIKNLQETFMNFRATDFKGEQHEERWREAHRAMAQEIPEIMRLVEKDFREILGYKAEEQ